MKVCSLSVVVASSLMLTSCGGSSGSGSGLNTQDVTFGNTLTGQFVDAPVKGLNYYINGNDSTVSQTGSDGSFTCSVGDYVTFRLGANMILGNAACGTIVAPTYFGAATAAKVAAILQNIGGGAGATTLDVSSTAATSFPYTSIASVADLTTLNNVLTAASASTVADYNVALQTAEAAMNDYLSTVTNISEEYLNKTFTFNVTANLVEGSTEFCDTTSTFKAVATTQSSNEDGDVEANVVFFNEDNSQIGSAPLYSTTFHVGFEVEEEDETYFVNGSGSFNDKGFSGSYVETVLEAQESEYVGVSCAYSFSNVAPATVVDNDPEESFAE